MHTRRHRLAYWTTGVLALVVLLLATAPLLFRGRVEAGLKDRIGSGLDARVDWGAVGLGLFRNFPNLTLRVDDLVVSGTGSFEGERLLAVRRSRVVLDLGSVVRGARGSEPVVVRSFELDEPVVRLLVLEDGTANWDLARAERPAGLAEGEAREPDSARPIQVALRSFTIRDGSLVLEDRQSGLDASVTGLRQTLRGDFGRDRFSVRSDAGAESVSLRFAGIPYLSRARLEVLADLDVDTEAGQVAVRQNRIRLNDLVLETAGSVRLGGGPAALDLELRAPGMDFGQILSLVPAVYAREFETIRTSGTMSVGGWVRGAYGPGTFPAFALEARVEDGMFRYPDLPLPARDVALDLSLTNDGGDLDRTVLDIRRFRVVFGSDAVEGSLAMRTPVSDPDLDLRLAGRLDLADLRRTVKLEGVEELSGVVVADAAIRARRSDLDARRYDRIGADGSVAVTDLLLRAIDLPHPLLVEDARLRLSPRHAELERFRGRVGSSDLTMTGRLDNLLGFALRAEELRGEARVTSRHVNLDEWRSDDEAEAVAVPANIDFALDAAIDRITFGDLDMRNARGRLRVRDQRLTLDDFRLEMLGGAMTLAGFYETADPARPIFDMDLRLTDVDVPAAFAGLGTVRAFAPVARYATGRVSAELRLNGALGPDLEPVREALSGLGTFQTTGLSLQDFPPLDRLADAVGLPQLHDPALSDFRSTLVIQDGRLHVRPFDVRVGPITMNVAGSNGLDQSLQYVLGLEVPRHVLGGEADRVVAGLISRTERAGLQLQPTDVIALAVQLTGTVASPAVHADFAGLAGSGVRGVEQALRHEADRRVEAVEQRFDAAAEEARLKAEAEAARVVAEAEVRAAAIREEAAALADRVRREGAEQADVLLARATNPAAQLAARAAADRLRREADERADRIAREADARADALIQDARDRAALRPDG
jgi:hypothetical protein